MNFAILVRWGNGFMVMATGKTQEELGEINRIHNWVITGIRLRPYELIGRSELEDFEVLQKPGERLVVPDYGLSEMQENKKIYRLRRVK
ncbi:MAG: hypothetical protein WC639_04960 [Patescibacteria group bacterium]|jgi:hypothetical protein